MRAGDRSTAALGLLWLVLLAVVLLKGCTPPTSLPAVDACSSAAMVESEAQYLAEVLFLCDGRELDHCVELGELELRHAERVEAWVLCPRGLRDPARASARRTTAELGHAVTRAAARDALLKRLPEPAP